MSTLRLPANTREQLPVTTGRQVFLYVVDGDVTVDGESANPHHPIEVDRDGVSLVISKQRRAPAVWSWGCN